MTQIRRLLVANRSEIAIRIMRAAAEMGIHTVAIFAAALRLRDQPGRDDRWLGRAAALWGAGVVLFSGSLYWLALGGPRWLGPVTPLGGVALLAGWTCVVMTALANREQ